jgi:hypothetical protein
MATSSSVVKEIKIIVDAGKATVSIDGMTSSISEANAELVKLSKNAGKGKAASGATGGATATVLELGRTISDSNYGIRGMANNLSQLVSNLAFTTKAAGGFAAGLKSIWSAMMGPLGLVLAFQGVIALLERFEINSMKASSASKDLDDSLKDEITTLGIYKSALLDVNTTLQERVGIIKGLSALDNKLAEDLKNAAGNTKEIVNITEKYIEQLTLQEKLSLKKIELNEAIAESTKLVEDKEKDLQDIRNIANADIDEESREALRLSVATNITNAQEKQNKVLSEYLLLWSKVTNEEKENAKESKKVFKQKYLDLSKIILGFQREEEIALEENEVRKFAIQKRYQEQDLLRRRENFEEKERLRLEEFKRSNASDEEKLLAEKKFEESILTAKMDYFRALLALEDKYNANVKMRDEERYRGYEQRLREAENEVTNIMLEGQILRANNIMQGLDIQRTLLDEKLAQDLERINKEEEEKKKQISNLADRVFIEEEYERQRTAAKQQNSNDRIAIDEAERNARMETLGLLSGAFTAFASLSGKATKRHKQLAIAGALIDTYAGVDKAFNDPTIPSTLGRFALGASTLVKGLMNVRKISSINPNSTSTPTPQAGGGGDRTFDFNLVGSTGTNQLAEAVGSQFQEPVQAYVVSSQMTSQQELDLQISTGASLGGD